MPAVDASGAAAPSTSGDYYCDANDVSAYWCTEVDLLEANTAAMAATPHKCDAPSATGFVDACDRGGCGMATKHQSGAFGPGPSFTINTLAPFSVSTAFPADGAGALAAVNTVVTQGARSLALPHTPASCGGDYFANMTAPLRAGMVPIFSTWGDTANGNDMTWLDAPPCAAATGCSQSMTATFSNVAIYSL